MRKVAELFQNLVELLADVVESLRGLWLRELAGQADSDAECGQMLLRSVMEVALDLSALGVARGHDACTRCAELRASSTRAQLVKRPFSMASRSA